MHDVIVIGAGPIGSRVAYQLAANGHKVLVLEKREAVGLKPCCTGIISQECVDAFSIPPEVILHWTNSARLFSPNGNSFLITRPETKVCIVDRPTFDRHLAAKAQSAGAEYILNTKAENVSITKEKVTVTASGHLFESKAVVLATGFSAPLVKELGLGRVSYYATGAQAEVDIRAVEDIEVYLGQKLAPGFFAWLVPTTPGKGLLGLLTRRKPGLYLRELISSLQSQGKLVPPSPSPDSQHPTPPALSPNSIRTNQYDYPIRYAGIPLKPLPRTYGNRLLVVGDAAGQVKPTTGGGLYFGLLCADLAADTLHNAIIIGRVKAFSAQKLSVYEKAWRQKLGRELRVEYFVRRCYERLSDRFIDRLFSRIKSNGIADSLLQSEKVAFDWHGGLILKALRRGAVSEAKRFARLPLSLIRK